MADLQVAAVANSNGTVLNVVGRSLVAFQIAGTFSATITFEGTVDQQNWVAIPATNIVSGAAATTATAAGVYQADCAALTLVRARISSYVSGSVSVIADVSISGGVVATALPAGAAIIGKVGIDQTTPGTTNAVQVTAGSAIVGKVGIDQTTPGTTDRVTVGGIVYVSSTPTLSVASAYASGDYVGPSTTPTSFAGAVRLAGGTGIIQSIAISDAQTAAAVAMELWLFSATVVVPLDSAAWAITDADALLCVGVIPITTDRWFASANNKVYADNNLSQIITCAATSLFYAIVIRGTPPSWASGDLRLSLGIVQA